ncbi:MAG TPA: toprim domain-containing protein, partial [Propionicimonas sp.]
DSPPRDRLVQVNNLTLDFYECRLTDSWARNYIADRFGQDLAGTTYRPGYAPDGWTGLVHHLRRQGVSDDEMLEAGVALRASTGRLIDRFRDRAMFPITDPNNTAVLGFVGRRNPAHGDEDRHGPKYLNTAETALFSKGDQLYVAGKLTPDTVPVITEGPFDALAVTIATGGSHIGVAALGTSLTVQQVLQLHGQQRPIVATDPDFAGRVAAERDYWLLTSQGHDPSLAVLPDGFDPADLIASGRTGELAAALHSGRPLAETLIDERLDHLAANPAAIEAVGVLAAQPPEQWTAGAEYISNRAGVPSSVIRSALVGMTRHWNADRRRAAEHQLAQAGQVKQRLAAAASGAASARLPERSDAATRWGRSRKDPSPAPGRPVSLDR